MKQILNDAKAKYFHLNKSMEQVLIENCPMSDYVFTQICEAYNMPEEETMECMCNSTKGEFIRVNNIWDFKENN